jgi:hypothetical protein
MSRTRKTGAMVKAVPKSQYAVFLDDEGKLRVIGREGVSTVISRDGFFTGDYLHENIKLTYAYLMNIIENGEEVDLSRVIRIFGDRLEANFHINYCTITGEMTAHE